MTPPQKKNCHVSDFGGKGVFVVLVYVVVAVVHVVVVTVAIDHTNLSLKFGKIG